MRIMNHLKQILTILTLISFTDYYAQSFTRNSNIGVLNDNGDTLKNPWAGGLNSVQFSEIDLDLDGTKDLISFDRSGNRLLTYINSGEANKVSYTHDPQFQEFFPEMKSWVLLRDYNCDGKMDIFTYFSGGIRIYKNTSTSFLSFAIEDSLLKSNYQPDAAPNFIPLYVSSADIPAIDDIDNDGDLDILTFSVGGTNVEYHKNLTQENNGNCDSLTFELSNKCWGFFKESSSNNSVILYDTCAFNINNPQKISGGNKHSGSSLLTLDVDANNSKDLVLGDVSYSNLTLLYNQDSSPQLTASSIIAQDTAFPANNSSTIPVDLFIFPAGFYLDVNNDNVKDLVCGTNATFGVKNTKNVWFYENNNADNNPDFNFISNAFLQGGMIEVGEGAHPVFFDHNSDGLLDIVVGNYGIFDTSYTTSYFTSLWLYENIGTIGNPSFQLIDSNYANIANINLDIAGNQPALRIIPTFGDLDGDNDEDMIIGDYNGYLHYFENTAGAGNTANFALSQAQYLGIDVGHFAAPQLVDLNRDNLLDLVIGERFGYIRYYQNMGTTSVPSFPSITIDSLGNVKTRNFGEFNGNNIPCVYEDGGIYKILAGSSNGHIYQFTNIEGNLNGTFNTDSIFLNIWEGVYSAVNVADVTGDGNVDMLIGNQCGGVAFYQGDISTSAHQEISFNQIKIYPNPTSESITIDLGETNYYETNIEIIDLLGKNLYQTKTDNVKTNINISHLSNGLYLLKINNELGNQVLRFIKK